MKSQLLSHYPEDEMIMKLLLLFLAVVSLTDAWGRLRIRSLIARRTAASIAKLETEITELKVLVLIYLISLTGTFS